MSFPLDVLDLAESRRLGEPVRAFDARPDFRRAVTWLVLLGPAGVLLVASSLFYLVVGPRWLGAVGVLLAAAYLGGVGSIVRGAALRGRGLAVYAFEDGLVRLTPRGTSAHRWDELHSVTMAMVRPASRGRRTQWRFTVTGADGAHFVLGDELPGVRDLGEAIVAEVARRELPRRLAEVEEGRTVRFGPFTVDGTGVGKDGEDGKDGEVVPWESAGESGIGNGQVYVRRSDGTRAMSAAVGLVPDALVFVGLCRRMRDTAGSVPARRASR
ncbi:hypothetical protein SAMN04489712_11868 [Thermomonospora echinospora]|uniref:Uncharacterized protein n=1 Tax=Thermomonospora echinospora TaxID=1992 RepID=A0A1H6DKB9_9ACTN|nr:DUF6585 family protein [Thermomonospora echinospora]SEG85728.1 hypothetical protein SAMN04489712_11868 [Thermomonospora echinospora]